MRGGTRAAHGTPPHGCVNRIDRHPDRSAPVPLIPPGLPVLAQAPPGRWWRSRPDPRWRWVGMVNTANRSARPAGRKDAGLPAVFRGCMCIRSRPRPAIDDFTSKEAAIVGLAKLTDASEVRLVLQVAAEADNPTHLDLTLDQQRAKRSLRLSARANGMWAITGIADEVDGAILAETSGIVHPPPDTHDTPPPRPNAAPMP